MAIFKRGRDWWIDFYVKDPATGALKRRREKAGPDRLGAEASLLDRKRALAMGARNLPLSADISLADYLSLYLQYSRERKKSFRRDVSSVKALVKFFGNQKLSDIAPSTVEGYIGYRKKSKTYKGTPPTPSCINRELALLKHALNRAVRDGCLRSNPMKFVAMLKENPARDIVMGREQFKNLLDTSAPHLRPLLMCAYHTAMRLGEMLNLKWSSVNLKEGKIALQPDETKTYEKRSIPIDAELDAVLRDLRRRSLKTEYVFNRRGRKLTCIKTAFDKAKRRAGVGDFRFHDFRHAAITNWRRAGIHDFVIMKWSGHKTMEVFRRYNTVDENDFRDAIRKANVYNGMDTKPQKWPQKRGHG